MGLWEQAPGPVVEQQWGVVYPLLQAREGPEARRPGMVLDDADDGQTGIVLWRQWIGTATLASQMEGLGR